VAAQVVAAAGEDGVQLAGRVGVERHQHGRVLSAVHVHGQRLLGVEEDGREVGRGQP
jgi:hypothetical protein